MKKIASFVVLLFLLFLTFNKSVFAQSAYVLPYPSYMPGSSIYKIHLIWEELMSFYYFGNFAQLTYNLKQTDKYLVEARTLFEYKQYLLAVKALEKSNKYFEKTQIYLDNAKQEGKDITQKKSLLKNAALKHIEVIDKIRNHAPETFTWEPEKDHPSELNISGILDKSKKIRERFI